MIVETESISYSFGEPDHKILCPVAIAIKDIICITDFSNDAVKHTKVNLRNDLTVFVVMPYKELLEIWKKWKADNFIV